MAVLSVRWWLAAACLATTSVAQAADLATSRLAIERSLDDQYTRIEALYKDIYAHPELGFQEARTAGRGSWRSIATGPAPW